jgi:hypothetical protein
MSRYLPILGIHRSNSYRVGLQKLVPDNVIYVDIDDGAVKRDLQRHSAIGAYIIVGPLSQDTGDVVVQWGLQTTEGASGADLVITTEAGELRNRETGDLVDVDQTDLTIATADVTNPRIDLVQVHATTGVVTKKNGTAAASPAAPAPDANNIAIANVSVPANDTAITTNQITDRRPRG